MCHPDASDHRISPPHAWPRLFWGLYAIVCAQYIKGMGSLVEAVNVLGSLFYGGMLGRLRAGVLLSPGDARGAICGVIVGQVVIFACWRYTGLAFLWYNVVGCVVVVLTGLPCQRWTHKRGRSAPSSTPRTPSPPSAASLSGPTPPVAARRARAGRRRARGREQPTPAPGSPAADATRWPRTRSGRAGRAREHRRSTGRRRHCPPGP